MTHHNVLQTAAGVLVLAALAAARAGRLGAASNNTESLVENVSTIGKMPKGTAHKIFELNVTTSGIYNVRVTRLYRAFKKQSSAMNLCVGIDRVPVCSVSTYGSNTYSRRVSANHGQKIYAVLDSRGEEFDYAIRACRGSCPARCSDDCNNHGACSVTLQCKCDAGYEGASCGSRATVVEWSSDAFVPVFGFIFSFLVAVLSMFSTFLPCFIVLACAVCACATRRGNRGRVVARRAAQQQQVVAQATPAAPAQPSPVPVQPIYVPLPPPIAYARNKSNNAAGTAPPPPPPPPPPPQQQQPQQQPQLPPPPVYPSLYPAIV